VIPARHTARPESSTPSLRDALPIWADLLNDAWGGVDPKLAEVAAEFGVGLVCAHTGGVQPRTRPHRVEYDDVMADVIERTVALADRKSTRLNSSHVKISYAVLCLKN